MEEKYFSLKSGKEEKQLGVVLRTKDGKLEELTGFIKPKKIGEVSKSKYNFVFYEANLNTDGHGDPKDSPDIIGLMVSNGDIWDGAVDIYKQPKKKTTISEIPMSEAAKILEDVQSIRNSEAFIA